MKTFEYIIRIYDQEAKQKFWSFDQWLNNLERKDMN